MLLALCALCCLAAVATVVGVPTKLPSEQVPHPDDPDQSPLPAGGIPGYGDQPPAVRSPVLYAPVL